MRYKLIYVMNSYSQKSDEHFFHIINLLENLADKGVDIALIIEKSEGLPVFKNKSVRVFSVTQGDTFTRILSYIKILSKLYKEGYKKIFIRISQPAAILSILYSFFNKLQVYYWHSGTVLEYDKNHKSTKQYLIDHFKFWFIHNFCFRFVTGPESMENYYVQNGVSRKKIMILYNDIDINRFSKNLDMLEAKEKLSLPSDKKIILFVHRLSPVRETLYYLPFVITKFYETYNSDNYIFIIIGSGPELPKLTQLVQENNLSEKVFILGSKPNSIIQDFYAAASIFINPTMAEGFPRVLLEAQAAGLPIVTTDAGGIKDIISNKQQFFMTPKKDKYAFANALIQLASDAKLAVELGLENREFVKRFSTDTISRMYINKIFQKYEN